MSLKKIIEKLNVLIEDIKVFYYELGGKGMYAESPKEPTHLYCDSPDCSLEILENSCFYSYARRQIFHRGNDKNEGCGEEYRLKLSEIQGPQHWTLFEIPRYRALEFLKENRLEQSTNYQRKKIEKLRLEERIEEE